MKNANKGASAPIMSALKTSASLTAMVCAANAGSIANAQTLIMGNPAVLNNIMVIDAGAGAEQPGVVVVGEAGGTELDISNAGTIQGRGNAAAGLETAGDGIRFERARVDGSLMNPSTALFTGTILNQGTIDSEGANGTVAGIRFVDGVSFQGALINDVTGVISGVQNGLYFGNPTAAGGGDHTGGAVINNGLISSDSRALNIDGLGLSVTNTGTILGTGNQRNGTVYADGTADDFALINSGVIDAGAGNNGSGFGVEIGGAADGANSFTLLNSGVIQGRGNAAAPENGAGDGVRIGNVGNTGITDAMIVNEGLILSEGANGTVAGLRVVDGVGFQGTLTNTVTGEISGIQNGVYFGNGDHTGGIVNNEGLITSDSRAFNLDGTGLGVVNSGTILGTADQRNGTFYADGTADDFALINTDTGVIDAGMGNQGSGFAAEIGSAADGANTITLTNNGTIQGRGSADAATGLAGDGVRFGNVGNVGIVELTASNTGTIASESTNGTTAGVRFVNGISFAGTFDNAGTITGVQNGVYFGNPVMGEGADHSNGVFNNLAGGVISSDSRAFNIDGIGLTINNAGTILGTGDQRNGTVYADSTAQGFSLNNLAGGVIDAGMGLSGAAFSVELSDTGNAFTIDNAGDILGRGQADAGAAIAGDGLRFERTRVMGMLDGSTTGLFTGVINNSGTISSESAQGTTAGIRFVNGVSFQGELNNTGTISGVQNGLYFGNAVPAGGADHTGGVVNNLAGGVISSDSRALNIDGTGLVVNNAGSILGTGNQRNGTAYSDGTADAFALNNLETGVIDAGMGNVGSGFAAEIGGAADGANTITLTNAGTIQGRGSEDAATGLAGDGVRFGNVGNVGTVELTATNTGTIASESTNGTTAGVRFVNGISFAGTFDNAGTITGVQNGVYFGNPVMGEGADHSNGVFNNLAGGVISSDSRAFNIDGLGLTVNNAGSILGTGNQRNGTAYSDGTADAFALNNLETGVIDAGMGNVGSGFAAEIGGAADGANTITLTNAGTIQGRGSEDAATGLAGDGVRFGNVGNIGIVELTASNTGTIASESTNGTTAGVRFVNGISFAGTFDNAGTITGVQNGVYFGNPVMGEGADHSNGVFNNLAGGVISSDSRAFNIDGLGLTVNNAGSILGTGNQRNGTVYADGTADNYVFNNLAGGVIDAGEGNTGSGFGAEIGSAPDGANTFTLVNDGTIQGRGNAPAGENAAGDGVRIGNVGNIGIAELTATNTGTIASEGANGTVAGVRFVNGISFAGTFDNAGTITGVQNGVYFGNPVMGDGANHSNGVFNNLAGGIISSGSRAFNIDGFGLTLNNAGSILGLGDQRNGTVYADATADNYVINNLAGGVIDAGTGNNGSGVSLQSGDVDGEFVTFTVNNAGFIAGRGDALASGAAAGLRIFNGAANIAVDGTIVNAGEITSESSAAILIENVDFIGTITNSGILSGVSAVDASAALGAINFVQTGGALNADFIGSAFADTVALNGGVLAGSILGGVTTTVGDGSIVTVSGMQTLEGDLIANGTLNFNLGVDSLTVTGNTTFGFVNVDGFAPTSIVNIATPLSASELILNAPISVISETGTFTDNSLFVNVLDDDFLIDYVVSLGSVTVTPTAANLANISADTNVSAFGAALTSAFAAGQLNAGVANALNDSPDVAAFEANTLSLLPAINEGATREVFETFELSDQFITRRLQSDAATGAWIQGFGRTASRDADSLSVSGYDASAFGLSVGADTKVSDIVTIGASFNYANISIDGDNAGEETDIDSFQIAGYAGYNEGPTFVNGSIGYIFGNGGSDRTGLTGPISGEFDISGFTAQSNAGYAIENGVWTITPNAGLRFASLSQNNFAETGGLNLVIDTQSTQYLDLRAGVDLEGKFDNGFRPFLRGAYVYDVIGDARVFDVNFAGAAAPFTVSTTDPAQSRFDLNAGFGWNGGNGLGISVEYDGEFASGYTAHGGFIRARFNF